MTKGLRRSINASKRDETGAAPRYQELAAKARREGNTRAAETFSSLAKDERRHLKLLRRL
jgi:rubrerythrin